MNVESTTSRSFHCWWEHTRHHHITVWSLHPAYTSGSSLNCWCQFRGSWFGARVYLLDVAVGVWCVMIYSAFFSMTFKFYSFLFKEGWLFLSLVLFYSNLTITQRTWTIKAYSYSFVALWLSFQRWESFRRKAVAIMKGIAYFAVVNVAMNCNSTS